MMDASFKQQLLALAVGISCGVLAYLCGLPLPWMLGPMIGNTVAAMMRAPTAAPNQLRPYVIPVIGVMLGSGLTAEVLGLLGTWVTTLVLMPVFLTCAAGISYLVYRRIGGYDPTTAYFSAVPGGLNEMLIVGGEAGGDEKRIALAHAARILVVIIFVALFFGLVLGVSSNGTGAQNWTGFLSLSLRDYIILSICAIAGVWLAKKIGLPAAPVFGPMLLSGVAHVAGWVTLPPPTLLVIGAQITMGTIIGTRFAGATVAELRRDISLAALATLLMLVITLCFAEVVSVLSGLPLAQAFLAYSPGGLTEMALLTLALDQDVTYVAIMHIIRITMVIGMAPLLFAWAKGKT